MKISELRTAATARLTITDPRLSGVLGLFFAIGIWLLCRPYRGIRHDAVLYAGQALHRLWPERFNNDLFFVSASQDRFSAFSPIFAPLVSHFGLAHAELFGLLACQVAFVVAVWCLAARLTPATRLFSVLCVAVFPHTYASLNVFGYAENFLTARSVAEPLSLFALLAWTQRLRVVSAVLFLAAGAMHPLIALPMLFIVWVMEIRSDRRWLWLLAMLVPVVALAIMGVAPFDGLLHRYDDDWWAQVHANTRQVLPREWVLLDWLSVAVDMTLLWMASRVTKSPARRLLTAALWSVVCLIATSWVTVEAARDVLFTSLQLWRVLWIGHLLALMFLPVVVLFHWRRGDHGSRLVAVATIAALLAVGANIDHAEVFLLWLAAALYLRRHAGAVSATVHRGALAATVIAILTITGVTVVATLRAVTGGEESAVLISPWLAAASLPVVGLLICFVLLALISLSPSVAAYAVVAAILIFGGAQWDKRPAWRHFIEAADARPDHPFDRLIAPSRIVYWPDATDATWFMLKRPQYFDPEQAGGVAFSRATATEFEQRRAVLRPLEIQGELCRAMAQVVGAPAADDGACSPTPEVLQGICHSTAHPDFMVFPVKLSEGVVDAWTFTPAPPLSAATYYLYDCARI